MSRHASVIGIDGSGKSSVSRGAPERLARALGCITAHAGDTFEIFEPGADGRVIERRDVLPLAASLATQLRRAAKRMVDWPWIYPPLKLAQMALQDSAAHRMAGGRLRPAWVVSDGNLLLNAAGRGGNYRRSASRGESAGREAPGPDDLAALFAHLVDGAPLPRVSRARLPPLRSASALLTTLRACGLKPAWLPDLVLFLDVRPEVALARVRSRGQKVDAHENVADLEQARDGYRRALDAFERYRGAGSVVTIDAGSLSREEAMTASVAALEKHVITRERIS